MRIFITGGAGYIGSHTLLSVLAADHQACVIDNFSNSHPDALTRVGRLIMGLLITGGWITGILRFEARTLTVAPVIRIIIFIRREAYDIAINGTSETQNSPVGVVEISSHLIDLQNFTI